MIIRNTGQRHGDACKTLGYGRSPARVALGNRHFEASHSTIEDMLAIAAERGEAPFLVLCDEISDPHNLGAIIRTAECVGAHGVIIPKRRSAG